MIKKDDRAMRKQKGKRAQETQMLGGMPKSLKKKVTSKIKWIYPSKAKKKKQQNQRRAAKEKMNDIKIRTTNCNPYSLKP